MQKKKTYSYILIVAALLGAILSAALIGHHVNPATDSAIVTGVCGTNSEGCQKVNTSLASELFGMPIAFWGFVFYALLFIGGIFYLVTDDILMIQSAFILSVAGLLVDIFLFLYSVIKIDAICSLCVITYFATIISMICAFLQLKQGSETGELKLMPDLKSLGNQKTSITLALVFAIVLAPVTGSLVYAQAQADLGGQASNSPKDPAEMMQEAIKGFVNQYRNTEVKKIDLSNSPTKGASKPSVIMVEYADFLCPYCNFMGQQLDQVKSNCKNLVQVAFKHYPLDKECNGAMRRQLHAGACKLSYASYCAQQQGKFWNMHDAIFAKQADLAKQKEKVDTDALARAARLNLGRFKSCMNSEAPKKAVAADIAEANRIGVQSTPTVFINGRKMRPIPLLMGELAKQEAKQKFGGTPECKR